MQPFDRLFSILTKPLVIVLYMALVICSMFYFDIPVATYFYNADLRSNFIFLNYLTKIGLGGIYFPLFFGLALFFRFIRKDPVWEARFWFLFLCLAIPAIISLFLKINLGRARPALLLQDNAHLYGFFGFKTRPLFWSFPSGHVTTIMSVVLGLGILLPRYFYALILLGLAVGLSRVLLTHHYLSDVLFTSYLLVIEIGLLLAVLKRKSWLTPAWKPMYNN
ncbi:MAG: phosphatase PAP2 family protein [Tatlockia sp.]|nr:phosphatase PAP2 family protein [Tatlockia sp.]